MYYYLKVREAKKLLFVVDVMKGDANNKADWGATSSKPSSDDKKTIDTTPITIKPAEPAPRPNEEGTNLGEPTDAELDGEGNPNDFGNFEDAPDDDWQFEM